ncbi:ATP-binding protein [Pseudonocardia sp. ICBG601]|uniref:ATP-binding protein n=1 Tax=Pseudonocardia sp. ICBG601 TaxID=2846759 RepID=UPI001CF632A2|nr:ATP-binding protein [Pseudonocardia sp. ICBG601]
MTRLNSRMFTRRRRSVPVSRSTGELLTAFTDLTTEQLTIAAPPETGALDEGVAWNLDPRRGHRELGRGWAPVDAARRLPVFRATTDQIGGLFPLLAAHGVPAVGARMGYDVATGGSFYTHPPEWVLRKIVTNPNMMIFGKPGRGKSSTVCAFCLRMMPFGFKTLISGDRKGEYTPVLRALGIEPIALGPGSPRRLNALDLGPLRTYWPAWSTERQRRELDVILGRWNRLLLSLAAAQGHVPSVTDEYVLHAVLRRLLGADDTTDQLRPVTIPQVTGLLADPDTDLWAGTRFVDRTEFTTQTRAVTDALSNLVTGPLAGLFDAETNFDLDWDAPIQSMDLSRLDPLGDKAMNVALTCLGMWSSMLTTLHNTVDNTGTGGAGGAPRIVVRDEVWRQMGLGLRAVQAINADLRLSRSDRTIQLLIMHQPSDLHAVGAAGSHEAAIARDFLALCSTKILLGQSDAITDDLADQLGLSETEQAAITGWAMAAQGRALWKLDNRPGMKIQTVLSGTEKSIFDTDAGMRSGPRAEALTSINDTGSPDIDQQCAEAGGDPTGTDGVNDSLTKES